MPFQFALLASSWRAAQRTTRRAGRWSDSRLVQLRRRRWQKFCSPGAPRLDAAPFAVGSAFLQGRAAHGARTATGPVRPTQVSFVAGAPLPHRQCQREAPCRGCQALQDGGKPARSAGKVAGCVVRTHRVAEPASLPHKRRACLVSVCAPRSPAPGRANTARAPRCALWSVPAGRPPSRTLPARALGPAGCLRRPYRPREGPRLLWRARCAIARTSMRRCGPSLGRVEHGMRPVGGNMAPGHPQSFIRNLGILPYPLSDTPDVSE